MKWCLSFARRIDRLNDGCAVIALVAVLAACLISAGNAAIRYGLNWSSNALLEIQWYLFAACVMLGAAQVLRLNEHVRVDVMYGLYPTRTKVWVDLFGLVFFLLPVAAVVVYYAGPLVLMQFERNETSPNAGGLIRWPVTLMLPLGMSLLALQALSEVIKRVAWLRNLHDMETHYERPLQ